MSSTRINPRRASVSGGSLGRNRASVRMSIRMSIVEFQGIEGEDFYRGPVLVLKNGFLGKKWKPKFAVGDNEKLGIWDSEKDVEDGKEPNHGFALFECKVTESRDVRQHSLTITDTVDKRSLTFAVNNGEDYTKWLTMLNRPHIIPKNVADQRRFMENEIQAADDDDDMTVMTDLQALEEDIIADYFHRHNVSEDLNNPKIEASRLKKLMVAVNPHNNPNIYNFILRQLGISPSSSGGAVVALEDMKMFWKNFTGEGGSEGDEVDSDERINRRASMRRKSIALLPLPGNNPAALNAILSTDVKVIHNGYQDSSHYFGVVDMSLTRQRFPPKAVLSTKVPTMKQILPEWLYKPTSDDWNEAYQFIVEAASGLYDDELADADVRVGSKKNTPKSPADDHKNKVRRNMESCLSIASYTGDFVKQAVEGVHHIVEEYALPDHLKTCARIALFDQEKDPQSVQEDVFSHEGLLFRVIAVPWTVAKAPSNDHKAFLDKRRSVLAHDEIRHKTAGNEFKAAAVLQDAVTKMHEDVRKEIIELRKTLKRNKIGAGVASSSSAARAVAEINAETRNKIEALKRIPNLSIPLTTIIDYAGFRVEVSCPLIDIDENSTMVAGYSTTEECYVNASAEVMNMLPRLGKQLNLSVMEKICKVTPKVFASSGGRNLEKVDVLSSTLHIHQCADDRFYAMNMKGILVSDLPRPHSYDALTHTLRPEFVKSYSRPLYSDALRESIHPIGLSEMGIDGVVKACSVLYSKRLREVMTRLDSLMFVPIDSYGLTQYLHSMGVNMRRIGICYELSKVPYIKQMLVIEAIGRTCKVLLNHTLRTLTRDAAADVMPTREHERCYILSDTKIQAVVDLFNLVLGSGEDSREFWDGILADAVFQKFGLDIGNIPDKRNALHPSQLFLALQYHCSVVFRDSPDYRFNHADSPRPFDASDIKQAFTTRVKVHTTVPGHMNSILPLAEPLMGCEAFNDAASLLRYRLSLQLLSNIDHTSPRETAAIGHTIHKLATALYFNQDYKGAKDILDAFLLENPQYGFLTTRMLTLRMCIDFKLADLESALRFFDVAHEMNSYCFGPSHIVHVQLLCTLADLYYGVGAVSAAALQLTMALDIARRVLGESDILFATIASKLAAVELQVKKRMKQSIRNLSIAALTFDTCLAKGLAVGKEASECLYILASNLQQEQRLDIAINCAVQSVEIASKVFTSKTPPYVAASLLLLGDLFYRKSDMSSSLLLLDDAYSAVRSNVDDYKSAGRTLAFIICSILAVHKATFTLPCRMLMSAVESEVRNGDKHTGVTVPGSWDHVVAEVVESLWDDNLKPTEMLSRVVREFQESEGSNDEVSDETKSPATPNANISTRPLTDGQVLAMKVAAFERLVRYAYPSDPSGRN